jgi:hypothetical protein
MLLSICIMVKNEEALLPKCLRSLTGAFGKRTDVEILVGDTGSTDKTVEIAQNHKVRVRQIEWGGHFAEARNRLHIQAHGQWIMWLDGDMTVSKSEAKKLLQELPSVPSEVDTLMCQIRNNLMGEIRTFASPRIFRSELVMQGVVHEEPVCSRIAVLQFSIEHTRPETPESLVSKVDKYNARLTEELFANPDSIHAYTHLLKEASFRTDWSKVRELLDSRPVWSANDMCFLATMHMAQNRPGDAYVVTNTGLNLSACHVRLWVLSGNALEAMGKYGDALEAYWCATSFTPAEVWDSGVFELTDEEIVVSPRMALAALLAEMNHYRESLDVYRDIAELFPSTAQMPAIRRNVDLIKRTLESIQSSKTNSLIFREA